MILIIALVVAVVGLVVWALQVHHKKRRREERRCKEMRNSKDGTTTHTYQCNSVTRRRHIMIPAANDIDRQFTHFWEPWMERFGSWYHPYTFDECLDPDCGHLHHVKGSPDEAKFYDPFEIAWRRFFHRQCLRDDESLLVRAGLIPESIPPLIERISDHAERLEFSKQYRPHLDPPPPIEKIPVRGIARRRRHWFH